MFEQDKTTDWKVTQEPHFLFLQRVIGEPNHKHLADLLS
jgi:hypothetical protein